MKKSPHRLPEQHPCAAKSVSEMLLISQSILVLITQQPTNSEKKIRRRACDSQLQQRLQEGGGGGLNLCNLNGFQFSLKMDAR
jgi:hypothetical protein